MNGKTTQCATVVLCVLFSITFGAMAEGSSGPTGYDRGSAFERASLPPSSSSGPNTRIAPALGVIVNGSFEANGGAGTNVFTGWTVAQVLGSVSGTPGGGDVFVQTGTLSPFGITVPAPPLGSFAAMSEQFSPGGHIIYQDFAVPAGGAILSFDLYIDNTAGTFINLGTLDFEGAFNQHVRVDIMNPAAAVDDVGAGVLQNILITNPGFPNPSGYTTNSVDISAFAGQTVRLRFAETDNQGYFLMGVDDVHLSAAAPGLPSAKLWSLSVMVTAIALAGLFFVARVRRAPRKSAS